ncbi:MAG TPA: hypothetical protein DCZ97_08460 [Syntrophus sp. (in: bacteria)]|nr:MAG: hypothetical protein A2X92_04810 [Syntrophus sp. GWC2_56_31]HBB17017.1 hypothetical protein [Syntrophus sp. (in: bacteria)]
MGCSFRKQKSRRFSRNAAFEANKKAAALRGSRLASFLVNPSKTPSSCPNAYEYYDAKEEKSAVR